jgi:hypothetical protein
MSDSSKRGIEIKYLLPFSPDRVQMGKMLKGTGAEVRFNPDLIVSDMRYMIVDSRIVVVGIPEKMGESEPTRYGYTLLSTNVASLFSDHFDILWRSRESKSYDDVLRELAAKARKINPKATPELIADNLKVDKEEIERVISK